MRFNFWNFKDWFFEHNIDLSYNISDYDADIDKLRLIHTRSETAPHSAGVCEGILVKFPECQCCMVQGKNWIKFPVTSVSEIMDLGNQMIDHYNQWESMLLDHIIQQDPLSSLLDLTAHYLNLSLTCHLISEQKSIPSKNWAMPLEPSVLNTLIRQVPAGRMQYIFRKISPVSTSNCLILSLDTKNERFGYLIVQKDYENLSPGMIALMQHFANILLHYFEVPKESSSSDLLLQNFFQYALSEYHLNGKKLKQLLNTANWPENQYFTLYSLCPKVHTSYQQQNNLTQSLKPLFSYSCIFPYQQQILCIVYASLDATTSNTKRLLQQVPSDVYTIGQSLSTQNIGMIGNYLRQSRLAADYAKAHQMHFTAAETILPFLLSKTFRGNHWIQALVHPDLQLLAASDQNTQDDLLRTLYFYLILGKNNTLTAQTLFIHRNTLRYRLNKIRSLISSDLEKEADITQLLASFFVFTGTENYAPVNNPF